MLGLGLTSGQLKMGRGDLPFDLVCSQELILECTMVLPNKFPKQLERVLAKNFGQIWFGSGLFQSNSKSSCLISGAGCSCFRVIWVGK